MSSAANERLPISATDEEQSTLSRIEDLLASQPEQATLVVSPTGEAIEIPEALYRILRQAVHHLTHEEAVSIIAVGKELTSQQAADLLNVSRPYLIQLLEQGEIPYRRVGTHRRIAFRDLITYEQQRDQERHDTLRELARMSQELGLYDKPSETP